MPGIPDSILVVRLGAIGDVVNALVFATAVKDAAPRTRIGWAVHPLAFPLVEGHPSVDRVHLWPRGGGLAAWKMVRDEVRACRYDLAVDLQRLFKSALLARSSGASRVLGYDRERAKELSWTLTRERIPKGDPREHMVEQYLSFARYLGIKNAVAHHLLPPDDEASAWARQLVDEIGAAPVLVNLGASKAANRWPPRRFGVLVKEIEQLHGVPVALTGGREDRDAARVVLDEAGTEAVDLVGQTDLRQLYHLMDHSSLFIGCDTGPMHLAVARQLPVVAMFGPADPSRTGPWGERNRIVRAVPYDPTGPFVPCQMEDLTPRQVLDSVGHFLE